MKKFLKNSANLLKSLFSDNYFPIFLTTVFFILAAISLAHHEIWRDEMEAWLIARDTPTLGQMVKFVNYEGHPLIWYFCLRFLIHLKNNPHLMQIFHLLIATANIFLFTRWAPFSKIHKFLFAFGYFPFYEYAVISRNYAMGIFFLFLFCILFKDRYKNWPLVGLAVGSLANTHFTFLIISVVIFFVLLVEYFMNSKKIESALKPRIYLGFMILLFGVIFSVILIIPPKDSFMLRRVLVGFYPTQLKNTVATAVNAFLFFPNLSLNYWYQNDNILKQLPNSPQIQFILGFLLLLYTTILLIKKPISFYIYTLSVTLILGLFYFKYMGWLRSQGTIFILFMASLWLGSYLPERQQQPGYLEKLYLIFKKRQELFLTLILAIQFLGGTRATVIDFSQPFSNAEKAANFIKSNFKDYLLVGYPDYSASNVAGFINQVLYYPPYNRRGTFAIWDQQRRERQERGFSVSDLIVECLRLAENYSRDLLLIYSDETLLLAPKARVLIRFSVNRQSSDYLLKEIARFDKALVPQENFYLYLFKKL